MRWVGALVMLWQQLLCLGQPAGSSWRCWPLWELGVVWCTGKTHHGQVGLKRPRLWRYVVLRAPPPSLHQQRRRVSIRFDLVRSLLPARTCSCDVPPGFPETPRDVFVGTASCPAQRVYHHRGEAPECDAGTAVCAGGRWRCVSPRQVGLRGDWVGVVPVVRHESTPTDPQCCCSHACTSHSQTSGGVGEAAFVGITNNWCVLVCASFAVQVRHGPVWSQPHELHIRRWYFAASS